jgi:hypothetical protein
MNPGAMQAGYDPNLPVAADSPHPDRTRAIETLDCIVMKNGRPRRP